MTTERQIQQEVVQGDAIVLNEAEATEWLVSRSITDKAQNSFEEVRWGQEFCSFPCFVDGSWMPRVWHDPLVVSWNA